MPHMAAAPLAALIGGGLGIANTALGKGKKTQYSSGLSPQAQGLSDQMSQYISRGLNQPRSYAQINPMSVQAMDLISRSFLGKGYTQPGYAQSAMGGGPQMPGSPQQMQPGVSGMQQRFGPTQMGMPQQMGRQMPLGIPQPGQMPQMPQRQQMVQPFQRQNPWQATVPRNFNQGNNYGQFVEPWNQP